MLSSFYRKPFYGTIPKGIEINNKVYYVSANRKEIRCFPVNSDYFFSFFTNQFTWMGDLRHSLRAELGSIVVRNPEDWKDYLEDFDFRLLEESIKSNHLLLEVFPPLWQEMTKKIVFSIGEREYRESVNLEFINYLDARCNQYGNPPYFFLPYGERMFYRLPEYCWQGKKELFSNLKFED